MLKKIKIETARTLLRPFETTDAEDVLEFAADPKVNQFTCDPREYTTLEEVKSLIVDVWHEDYKNHGYGRFAIEHKATGKVIGFCGFKYLTDLKQTDIGYRLLPKYWGQGLATETCLAVIAQAKSLWNISDFIALVEVENVASHRVLEKCGLKQSKTIQLDGKTILVFRR